jgi:hypothetical protein
MADDSNTLKLFPETKAFFSTKILLHEPSLFCGMSPVAMVCFGPDCFFAFVVLFSFLYCIERWCSITWEISLGNPRCYPCVLRKLQQISASLTSQKIFQT